MDASIYSKTALIIIDPFNDFLSEGGKLYSVTKETVEGISLVQNLKKLIEGARERKIQVIYAPHHHTTKEDYLNWKFLAPSHQGSKNIVLFEKNSCG
ncbi:isochorismatase family protein [Flavobacterium circumlabens]|uniref:Isochorismatase family protein n=1 Tax=Flavobacterium circumlabens TaxID=2133765 RepID=A0ABY2AU94_9FLAO|nr:isochorismatase family protein [Flavobacterium circumlabens]TCN53118.1 isochorismatase family protein [Flavobacterium circumlabens]